MDHQLHYDRLINRARNRDRLEGYKERHHITPKYVGGGNESSNLVDLTAREHYIAHLLWAKITRHPAAWLAVKQMATSGRLNKKVRTSSRMYEVAKILCRSAVIDSCRKAGYVGGLAQKERGEGIHAQTREDHVRIGTQAVINKTGIHGLSKDETRRNSQKGTARRTELILSGELIVKVDAELMRVTMKKTNLQVWECVECGYRNRACGVGNHQRRTKHTGKVRVA
jgi:hypothetical protein